MDQDKLKTIRMTSKSVSAEYLVTVNVRMPARNNVVPNTTDIN